MHPTAKIVAGPATSVSDVAESPRIGDSATGTAAEGWPMPELRTLLSGLVFGEQPRWHEDRLWFSDWGTQRGDRC
jgi:hypothetical protein